ncbi:Queuine tRNA-ribosyltransferase accessory subunit 2-like [Homarus americanus]|uniref:Queuine tRNA-ribosyltransferase accessory subunit 2 n=1 Tax=Homarus americanus TaxID=6706 RepID=A0A8J5K0R4_HOMAM|nr:Queuine tRNA-ribosyltransferase accessory subunit 2-like [Homarus americanus]
MGVWVWDVLHLVVGKDSPVCVPAQHFSEHVKVLQSYRRGVAHFSALQGHCVCVTAQDSSKVTPSGYNDKSGVSMWTYRGRQSVSIDKYMELVETMQPDWYEALNDADTDSASSKKRVSKSTAMSMAYLKQCIDHHKVAKVMRAAVGGHSEGDRSRWSKSLAEKLEDTSIISGYALLGLHTNGPPTEKLEPESMHNLIKASIDPLPADLPRQAAGMWNPLTVLKLAEHGVDIFDSAFPFLVTERRGALTFPCRLNKTLTDGECSKNDKLEHRNKRLKVCEDNSGTKMCEDNPDTKMMCEEKPKTKMCEDKPKTKMEEEENAKKEDKENQPIREKEATSPYEINLKDKSNVSQLEPLLAGCECYTCKNFTRAYVHHLANVNELLAPVLLMMHNLHHWMDFFTSIREAIKTDRLEDLRSLIESSVLESKEA